MMGGGEIGRRLGGRDIEWPRRVVSGPRLRDRMKSSTSSAMDS